MEMFAPPQRQRDVPLQSVVQHEVDHLCGILYPMRIKDIRHFGYTEVLFSGMAVVDD